VKAGSSSARSISPFIISDDGIDPDGSDQWFGERIVDQGVRALGGQRPPSGHRGGGGPTLDAKSQVSPSDRLVSVFEGSVIVLATTRA